MESDLEESERAFGQPFQDLSAAKTMGFVDRTGSSVNWKDTKKVVEILTQANNSVQKIIGEGQNSNSSEVISQLISEIEGITAKHEGTHYDSWQITQLVRGSQGGDHIAATEHYFLTKKEVLENPILAPIYLLADLAYQSKKSIAPIHNSSDSSVNQIKWAMRGILDGLKEFMAISEIKQR